MSDFLQPVPVRTAFDLRAAFIVVCLCSLLIATGCSGGSTPPPDTTAAPATDAAAPNAAADAPAASAAATGGGSDFSRKRAPNERWTDANGVQYLGDVPLDVFFDQPYQVASDTTPVTGAALPPVAAGTAPAGLPAMSAPAVADASTGADSAAPAAAAGGSSAWEELISSQALDQEVTVVRNFLNRALQSVGSYNSSMLMIGPNAASMAALAQILEQHPGDISWKEDAAYIRNLAKKMNESTLQRGKKDQSRLLTLFENMTDTFNRSRPAGLEEPPADDTFSDVAEMRLLMMRMEAAEKKMKNEAGSETAFSSQKDVVLHEASVLATMTKVITTSGYGYADDPEFVGYAQKIIEAAQQIRDAAETGNFGSYELALTQVSTACQECHSAYKNN